MRYFGRGLIVTAVLVGGIAMATAPLWGPPVKIYSTNRDIAEAESNLNHARGAWYIANDYTDPNDPKIKYQLRDSLNAASKTIGELSSIGASLRKFQETQDLPSIEGCTDGMKGTGLGDSKYRLNRVLSSTYEFIGNRLASTDTERIKEWRKAVDAYNLALECAGPDIDKEKIKRNIASIEANITETLEFRIKNDLKGENI